MPINPHTEPIAATHWGDQFGAEVTERSQAILEQALHIQGLCTEKFEKSLVMLLDMALESGAVAMALLLEEKGRIKEVGI